MADVNLDTRKIKKITETGIASGGNSDNYLSQITDKLNYYANLTSGSPATGAKVQITYDGTTWIDETSNSTADFDGRDIAGVKGIRLNTTDGTWSFTVTRRRDLSVD